MAKFSFRGLTSRREKTGTTGNTQSPLASHRQKRHSRGHQHATAVNRRPPFGQWLKESWLDILTFVILGAVGLGIYEAPPAPSRNFPIYFQDGEVVYPEFAYPLRKNIVPIWAAALIAVLVPIFFILVMQVRIRSFWDTNNAIMGLLYSVISAAVFQVFLKWLIGGLRPHFLEVCQPSVAFGGSQTGVGFARIMYDRTICTGDKNEIDDSLESFPSGHSTAAFAGFVFLYLYFNAKLKVWSNYHPTYWKLVVTYAPILGATLIAGSLSIDEFHNWYDVLAGAIIGTMFAFSAYRMVYAAVWDFRFNHMPLRRGLPFKYGSGPNIGDGFHSAIFTRKAGWGDEEAAAWGGAPFDASSGPSGTLPGEGVVAGTHGNNRHSRRLHNSPNRHSGGFRRSQGISSSPGRQHSGHRYSHEMVTNDRQSYGYSNQSPIERKPVPFPHNNFTGGQRV